MFLTLTSTAPSADDLGFLLHKHPQRHQVFPVTGGQAHVFYPEATTERCTVALLLEVDPVGLVRGRNRDDAFSLGQYVNDRPYAASSLLAAALAKVFRTALAGRCELRPELPGVAIPLELRLPSLPARGGIELLTRLFEPLGWDVAATPLPLDETRPGWGDSRYADVTLTGTLRVADALTQLYVLLPVLDDAKHYWVDGEEVEKLVRAGGGWLGGHPERDLIARRYLAHQRVYVETAIGRLAELDDVAPEVLDDAVPEEVEDDRPTPLNVQRRGAVMAALRASGATTVVDLGCGPGALLRDLVADTTFTKILGVDVSARALSVARRRLKVDRLSERQAERIELAQSSVTYRDARVAGFGAAVLMEVIEHVDPPRLGALETSVFGAAKPGTVVVTTPNSEHNVRYEGLDDGHFRHHDHRFEWTRTQFTTWADGVCARFGYTVRILGVGTEDPEVGAPTQMAVFTRGEVTA